MVAWSGKPTTPMEVLTDTSAPGREISATAARIRSAISRPGGALSATSVLRMCATTLLSRPWMRASGVAVAAAMAWHCSCSDGERR